MENLTLDAESLFSIADVIDGYCAKQRETINVYYAQIMALESDWRDDETFGGIAEEIRILKNKAITTIDEIYNTYPKYFRKKAQQILERPVMRDGRTEPLKIIEELRVPSSNGNINLGQSYVGRSGGIAFNGGVNTGSVARNTNSNSVNTTTPSVVIPNGTIPNSYPKTQQQWHQDGTYIKFYDSPKETGAFLNCHQGVPETMGGEGLDGFKGTCGLVSCENILRMAGLGITEAEVVNYAKTHKYGFRHLCTVNSNPENNGGTYPQDRKEILRHYGIDSIIEYSTDLEKIANYVSEGRGVIASVDACMLWYESISAVPARHAITITSVERDALSNEITAFYICDSGSRNDDSARRVRADLLYEALKPTGGELNVTKSIIR